MISKVDWISFSLALDLEEGGGVGEVIYAIRDAFAAHDPDLLGLLYLDEDLIPQKGRKPYSLAWQVPGVGITLYANPRLPHCLVEISGTGCAFLESQKSIDPLLASVKGRCTRIDIATDIPCDIRPKAFAEKRQEGRFKSFSEVESTSGSTYYVGARSSDRYARVYRYNPPHERAHLLRVEVVSKGQQAKIVADMLTRQTPAALANEFGQSFGWSHPLWQPDVASDEKLINWRPERHEGKSLFWLNAQVLPAMLKLHANGSLDLRAWWAENIEPKL